MTLQFPCLRRRRDASINVDLGTEMQIPAVEWRVWQGGDRGTSSLEVRLAANGANSPLLRHIKRQSNDAAYRVIAETASLVPLLATHIDDVRSWLHLADNPIAPAFVRFWTKADNGGFWPAMVCPLLVQ